LCLEDKQFESQPVYHFSQQIFWGFPQTFSNFCTILC
jgi:hypothetical protein